MAWLPSLPYSYPKFSELGGEDHQELCELKTWMESGSKLNPFSYYKFGLVLKLHVNDSIFEKEVIIQMGALACSYTLHSDFKLGFGLRLIC